MKKVFCIIFCLLALGCGELMPSNIHPPIENVPYSPKLIDQEKVDNAIKTAHDEWGVITKNPKFSEQCKKPNKKMKEFCFAMNNYLNTGALDDVQTWRAGGNSLLSNAYKTLNKNELLVFAYHYVEPSYQEWQNTEQKLPKDTLNRILAALEFVQSNEGDAIKKAKGPNIYNAVELLGESEFFKPLSSAQVAVATAYIEEIETYLEKLAIPEINQRMVKIQKRYKLSYRPTGYCEQNIELLLYKGASISNAKCIFKNDSWHTMGMKVMQVLPNGILVNVLEYNNISGAKIAFIQTNKKYVDGDFVIGEEFFYGGTFQHKTAVGVTKTIDKLIEVNI